MDEFYGVYLLYNLSEKYEGRVYIGFTVNPERRIIQHNKGLKSGGARRTNNKGPWEMVLIVHGFLNEISALRFEWAWQNPSKSRRLRHVAKKKSNERVYNFKIRILSDMLLVGPWKRLPLTIRWLKNDHVIDFPMGKHPPSHMSIVYGPFVTEDIIPYKIEDKIEKDMVICFLCKLPTSNEERIICSDKLCGITTHIICLSIIFMNNTNEHIIPIFGNCPNCFHLCSWADLIKERRHLHIKPNVIKK